MRARATMAGAVFFLAAVASAADAPKPAEPPPSPSLDDLYETGKTLFDQLAPDELKEQFEFPTKQQWDEFAARLQRALEKDDLAELAGYEAEARAALVALRVLPGGEEYADWLAERIDYIDAAKQATAPPAAKPPPPSREGQVVPYYDLWVKRVSGRAAPARARELMPALRAAFAAEGMPPEVAWLAEAESSLNPTARSPAGACGLFQFMPDTAKRLGLSTFLPDDRKDPEKSARAAARHLRALHGKFGEWPLAFAAYNAGEGRVQRLLRQRGAATFAEIAAALPAETRMYVPKVCATIAVRAGVAPERIAAPREG